MKPLFIFVFLFSVVCSSAQLSFPKGFKLIAGENPSGEDDVYTNGRYSFQTHNITRAYDYKVNDEKFKEYVTRDFGFQFYLTKDSLLWGTGKINDTYSYVVISREGSDFELFSTYNDPQFSHYSKWLLATIREYHKKGKSTSFPYRF
jgi:hypothetical protein